MRRSPIAQIQIDETLVRNPDLFRNGLEIENGFLVEAMLICFFNCEA